jgi:hypothetical protein
LPLLFPLARAPSGVATVSYQRRPPRWPSPPPLWPGRAPEVMVMLTFAQAS